MVKIFGHRGASAYARENTIEAFALAAAQGADGVELDVRLTADGSLVVHHDADIDGLGPISLLDRSGLPQWVPLLDDVISWAGDFIALNVEIKNLPGEPGFDPDEALASAAAAMAAGFTGELIISSFNPAALARVHGEQPSIATGWLTLPNWDQQPALRRAADEGHAAVHPHHLSVNAELCQAAHDIGLAVNTWTVDDPDRMVWLAEAGVDALITNVPDVAVAALRG